VQFYFQPELLLSLQGYRLENPFTQYQARIRFYYATLPLLLTASWKDVMVQAGVSGWGFGALRLQSADPGGRL
jgi:hypothetical protein